jgi:hypothetical protein
MMADAISEIESALAALGKPSPWDQDIKASDDFLDPLFKKFFEKLGLPHLIRKTDYHGLAPFVSPNDIDDDVRQMLDRIAQAAERAAPRTN